MKYVSEEELIDWTNMFNLTLHKRKSFAHENELRAVVSLSAISGASGVKVPTDLNTFIEKIYVSPTAQPWIFDLVKKIVNKYELKKDVVRSEINKDPLY